MQQIESSGSGNSAGRVLKYRCLACDGTGQRTLVVPDPPKKNFNNRKPKQASLGHYRFYNIKDIPAYFCSTKGWKRRGYRVVDEAIAMADVEYWDGQNWKHWDLFLFCSTVPILGKNAAKRRDKFASELASPEVWK